MKKRDNDSQKVSPKVANERKMKAAELFTASSRDGDKLNASCEEEVRKACQKVFHKFRAPAGYSFEDLVHDVILKILEAKEPFRGDCEIGTFIYAIARNHLRTLCPRAARCISLEALEDERTKCRNNEDRSEANLLDHLNRDPSKIHRNDVENHQFYKIAVAEFLASLTDRQRVICQQLEEGHTLTDIARSLGVSPQAMSRSKGRLNKKLMNYVNSPKEKVFAGVLK